MTPRLTEALTAYEAALTQHGLHGEATRKAADEIHRATYEAQGKLRDSDIDIPSDDPFWLARRSIRDAVDAAQVAVESMVLGAGTEARVPFDNDYRAAERLGLVGAFGGAEYRAMAESHGIMLTEEVP